MSLQTQKNLLRGFIQSMYDEGIVNDSFYQLQAMKETIRPDYVVRSVASYCKNVPNLFSQMSYLVNQPQVNFEKVKDTANDLYWRTSNVGAERVKVACGEIIRACDDNNKELCTQALYWTKKEYSSLRGRFETLVQIERKIIDLQNGH